MMRLNYVSHMRVLGRAAFDRPFAIGRFPARHAMDSLPLFLSLRNRQVILLGSGEPAAAKARLVTAAGGILADESATDPVLAFVAIADDAEAERAATRLRQRGLLVNVVDKPALSDFLMGAIIDRSPVVVAVSTGGASASLSRALRGRLEALLPASLGALAEAIGKARAAATRTHPGIDDRRRLWEHALAEGGALDPLRPQPDAEAAVAAAIQTSAPMADQINVIAVTSDDPGDLTLNQLQALGRCDNLVVDGDVAPMIVDRARRDAVRLTLPFAAVPRGLTIVLQASNSVSQ